MINIVKPLSPLNELKVFISCRVSKEKTIEINKDLFNKRFNHFDKYVGKVVYKAAMKAEPPENDNKSESVKVCCHAVMKNFNDIAKINEFIDQETKNFEGNGMRY